MKNILLLLLLLPIIGCLNGPRGDEFDFGSSYALSQTTELPGISNDSLNVQVAYSGCNGDHLFELKSRIDDSFVAELWLFKQTPDQPCDAYFVENRAFPLSKKAIHSSKIVLFGPGDKRITLNK